MPTQQQCRDRLEQDLRDWAERGIGYCAVTERATGAVIGWAGVRQSVDAADGLPPYLNLYFRLAHSALGSGYGREVARAVVAAAGRTRPDLPVMAVARASNEASLATCHAAGLVPVGTTRHPSDQPGEPPSVLLAAPRVTAITNPLDVPRSEVLDLWLEVTRAGGSVGFLPDASLTEIADALDAHLAEVARGEGVLVTMREGTSLAEPIGAGRLLGLGFWCVHPHYLQRHTATLYRLMVDPSRQGASLGRTLLEAMAGVARTELPGIELLRLSYRSGSGLGRFYASAGWTEVGRVPRAIRVRPGDDRDSVEMAMRVDGREPVAQGGF